MPDLSRILKARQPLTLAQVARGAQPLVMADLARASTGRAVFMMARRIKCGVQVRPSSLRPLHSKASEPQTFGDDIDVPFLSE